MHINTFLRIKFYLYSVTHPKAKLTYTDAYNRPRHRGTSEVSPHAAVVVSLKINVTLAMNSESATSQ